MMECKAHQSYHLNLSFQFQFLPQSYPLVNYFISLFTFFPNAMPFSFPHHFSSFSISTMNGEIYKHQNQEYISFHHHYLRREKEMVTRERKEGLGKAPSGPNSLPFLRRFAFSQASIYHPYGLECPFTCIPRKHVHPSRLS